MIQELCRPGVSISEIARQTGHDRKTVRQVIKQALIAPPKEPNGHASKFDPRLRPAGAKLSPFTSLSEANLERAKLGAAKYDSATKWPAGFDPGVTQAIKQGWSHTPNLDCSWNRVP